MRASYKLPRSITSRLSRLVWRNVDRLHHRHENFLMRNEVDLAPAYLDDAEFCKIIETIPNPARNPYEELVYKETCLEREARELEFLCFLGNDRRLKSLFTCYSNGIWQPRLIAPELRLSIPATKNLQKRLKRSMQTFLEQSGAV